jgi:MoaA/NifB/PqqE/SkfB family radical SAM enzyme
MTIVPLERAAAADVREGVGAGLDFLWLELTNRCNLQCVHCYTESGPHTGGDDVLTTDDYLSVMRQAYDLGCRKMQFIGGEPQLHADFQLLLEASKEIGFRFVEVFTNLTRLSEETVRFARRNGVRFATSVYSDDPAVHQAVTRNGSSHARTVRNLKRLIDSAVVTRAAVIAIDQQPEEIARTKQFLTELGVPHVRDSEVREFGRGEAIVSRRAQLDGLCGHCWKGRLCVAPDGSAYPCVMAREWPVGNVLEAPLAEIVGGEALGDVRTAIHDTVWLPKLAAGRSASAHALEGEDETPDPAEGEPAPAECPQSCVPDTVTPSCPQSCVPDTVTPSCPQSCDPFIAVCDPTEPETKE